ncbi:MAG: pilus assembly PilX family protein [Pontibacterium sp.]
MKTRRSQKGSVLIVALILLLIMTLIGTAGIEVTALEDKMTLNMRDRHMAFEGAEAALLQAEAYIEATSLSSSQFTEAGSNGLYTPSTNGTAHWEQNYAAIVASGTDKYRTFTASGDAFSQLESSNMPVYIIELVDEVASSPSLEVGQVVTSSNAYYRITAWARGLTSASEVRLQSVYLK